MLMSNSDFKSISKETSLDPLTTIRDLDVSVISNSEHSVWIFPTKYCCEWRGGGIKGNLSPGVSSHQTSDSEPLAPSWYVTKLNSFTASSSKFVYSTHPAKAWRKQRTTASNFFNYIFCHRGLRLVKGQMFVRNCKGRKRFYELLRIEFPGDIGREEQIMWQLWL